MLHLQKKLSFKFSWRSYQEKFLEDFESHKEDDHLHVVAPPGSGKTVLGLEMVLRVDKKTLILAPTLTVRNQWKNRLEEFFIEDSSFKAFSTEISNPSALTFSTYQSLHALDKRLNDSGESLFAFFKNNKIETLVLDEAHHLKNEWYNCLISLKAIPGITVIALTATPPYDSSSVELNKYFDLCGPIDEEIAVPELVKNKNLCPHQDYVYLSRPSEKQIQFILEYRQKCLAFFNSLVGDQNFINFLLAHPFYTSTQKYLEEIYERPSVFASILIFLNEVGMVIEKDKLEVLGVDEKKVNFPKLDYQWLETLLQDILIVDRDRFVNDEELLGRLESSLRKIGVFQKNKVDFVGNQELYKSLTTSPSKLNSINEILKQESASLTSGLRTVVLTDFIRKEFLSFSDEDTDLINQLGVVPVFQFLRIKGNVNKADMAVLTGSLIILHKKLLKVLEGLLEQGSIVKSELETDPDFLKIDIQGSYKNRIVAIITELFEQGLIKILIGTKALLGEGWDAPSINTLVLASYVGSFVSSNQMRGRAIRINPANENKTGNIWHLGCVDPSREDGGDDILNLNRRFDAFCGVSYSESTYIENGIERLHLIQSSVGFTEIDAHNDKTFLLAKQRNKLPGKWTEAISSGRVLVQEVKVAYKDHMPYSKAKRLLTVNLTKFLLIEVLTGIAFFLPEFVLKNIGTLLNKGALYFIYLLLAGIFLGFAPKTWKALKLYILFGNTFKKTYKMGQCLLEVLQEFKLVNSKLTIENVKVERFENGSFACYLSGANNHESSLFVNYLQEIINPVENPRYLVKSTNWFKRKLGIRNYYVVPGDFGKRKSDAILYHRSWIKYVGRSKLVYTRTLAGRKELLKARMAHIMHHVSDNATKAVTWK